jgi:uncharacterized membrane protein
MEERLQLMAADSSARESEHAAAVAAAAAAGSQGSPAGVLAHAHAVDKAREEQLQQVRKQNVCVCVPTFISTCSGMRYR